MTKPSTVITATSFVLKVDKNGIDEWQKNTIWANGERWIQELQQTNVELYSRSGYSSANI
ncbi:MAG: hypothetical protein IPP86_04280 [Bacteroidetes bacterium]|nr:hypothetical protein [Bacteroidota bacterium]